VTPNEICERASRSELFPVTLVAGQEELFRSEVVRAIREAAVKGGIPGLNEDSFTAGECEVDQVLAAARTLPMLSRRRFVMVRHLERWDGQGDKTKGEALDRLLDYASNPVDFTVMLLVGAKLDGRRRLVAAGKKAGWFVSCDPLSRAQVPGWVLSHAKTKQVKLGPGVAELIVQVAGTDLSALSDAIERLGLYMGPEGVVDEDAVGVCLAKVRTSSVWELVGAVGRKDIGAALTALDTVYEPQERGLPLLGVLAWSARQLLKFESAVRSGCAPAEAAQRAGAPPFRARELSDQLRLIPRVELERWLELLARVDLDLKGGSRRNPKAIIEQAVISLCRQQNPKASAGTRSRA
jgi:DNA polymerase III subunit delta